MNKEQKKTNYIFTNAQWGLGYGLTAAQVEAGVSYSTTAKRA